MNKKRKYYTLLIGIALFIASLSTYIYYNINGTIAFKNKRMLYIDNNDNIDSVYKKIEEPGVSLKGFKWLCHYAHYDKKIHTGAYSLSERMTSLELFKQLRNGLQTPVKVTIPSVRSMEVLAHTIGKQLILNGDSLAKAFNNKDFQKKYGFTKETFPCLFLANTYEIYWNTSLDNFMKRLVTEYHNYWNSQRRALAKKANLTPNEVTTIASIINEETNSIKEYPIIAGIYINRLQRSMPLQACPTVKFAMNDFTKHRIYLEDLKFESPYNTYLHTGLPPGPIRIPTLQAIEAVLHYQKHNYLYMCAKDDFSGTHVFARYNWEHSRNAKRYAAALNKRKIK